MEQSSSTTANVEDFCSFCDYHEDWEKLHEIRESFLSYRMPEKPFADSSNNGRYLNLFREKNLIVAKLE